ncbi:hypothetical protein KVR01_009448 [Diaporthe batatas]|uniref:uncharacterized protein n=1 Tax=Diaporthe batatas TaxID=748121 RepID=UPI001D04AFAF|nr:uncharacterized protein KVR01_009448 [Diaporthe batatas]KAG8161184.1 hypothetical protein KVR01_009448 [Diaporthe batatas]
MASEKRARAPSMDDHMEQDSPHPDDTPSSNQPDSGATPVSTTQTTGASTTSASNPSAGTPATAATAHTADTSSSAGTPNAPPAPSHATNVASKRRRGLGVVTPNACTECRKKRAKCDGQQPCSRCASQKDVECHYEVPVRQSKENLRNEIEYLRRQQASNESVISALSQNVQWEEVLRRLRSGQSVEAISDWLGTQMSSGAGPMPSFGQPSGSGSNLTGVATFAGASASSYTPGLANMALSAATVSPTSTVHPLSARQDMDTSSQWSLYSAASQAHTNRSNSQSDAMHWSRSGPPQTRVGSWVADNLSPLQHSQPSDGGYHGLSQVLTPDMPPPSGLPTTWTEVSSDRSLVQHLLALYFCWEYPTFASLSKEHFLKDFHHGRQRYCSPILVNALLALGCRFSTQPSTLANPDDPYSSGDHFFKESLRLFFLEDNHHSLTTIQALGIMSIREASCGRDSESWYYAGQSIRLAVEMGLHRVSDDSGDSDEVAVQAATFWGAFALDHAWSLATGSLPQTSCFPHLPPKPAIMPDIEASVWIPYTDNGAPLQRSCEQPSNVRSVYKCFCELSELVHASLYILHTPGRPVTGPDLLSIYNQFIDWYDTVPVALKLGHNFTPAVLFAHMYYHFAILLLFRPLVKLRIKGSSVVPRDVCYQAADAIQGLSKSYSQLYTLQRTPSFVPYFVLTAAIMHLAIAASGIPPPEEGETEPMGGPSGGPSTTRQAAGHPPVGSDPPAVSPHVTRSINQGIADLTEMAPCHHFAEQALNILRYLAKKWNIEVDMDVPQRMRREKEKAQREGREATRSSDLTRMDDHDYGTRAATNSLNFFAPNMTENDFVTTWGTSVSLPAAPTPTPSAPVARSGDSMENPLFWPFPMQGRPILPTGEALADAGFELV